MLDAITRLYDYNTWATERLFDSLKQLSEEQYTAPGCSGRGSIKETLAHTVIGQWGWIAWMEGKADPREAMTAQLSDVELASLDATRKRWREIDAQTHEYIAGLAESEVQAVRELITPDGQRYTPLLGELLMHVANHDAHHRAQIIAAIRRAGHTPGAFDLLHKLIGR